MSQLMSTLTSVKYPSSDMWLNTINFGMCHLVRVSRVTLGMD
jgi:hypothetical protein